MIQKLLKNRKGLSLIEAVIALGVFSIILLVSMAVVVTYLKGSLVIKKYQENNEELSLAMNYISKNIRMSALLSGTSSSLTVVEPNGVVSPVYIFTGTSLTKDGTVLIDKVNGSFVIKNSGTIPLVTIVLWKINFPDFPVQTSVSLRTNYK